MKYYIAQDLGCAYRLSKDYTDELEYAPLMQDNTFDTDEFSYVEPELVGEEQVTFQGVDTNLYGVYKTVTALLKK